MSQDDTIYKKFDIVIEPNSLKGYWRDLFHYREVLYILAYRDIIVRYKQTIFGLLWTVIRPLMSVIAFTIVFGMIAKLPSESMPYPVLVISGLLPWYFFSITLGEMSNSIVANQSMVSKIFFPRLLLPLSTLMVGLIDLAVSFVILLCLMVYFGMTFSVTLLAIPLFVLLAAVACTGLGLILASLNVQFRDVRVIIPFLLQIGMYISPVGFSSEIVPEQWRFIFALNPMVGVIDGFRWAVSGGATAIYWTGLWISVGISFTAFIIGLLVFRKTERTFADVV